MTASKRKGFSLIEVLIGLLIIGILFVSAMMIIVQTVRIQLISEDTAYANSLARRAVEEVKAINWTMIPLDSTGTTNLDPVNNRWPNSYKTEDGQYQVVRTITLPETNIKRITVNVFFIDSQGQAGVAEEPSVTMITDIYKFGM